MDMLESTPDQARPNFDPSRLDFLCLGKTKCSVILYDMIQLYDRKTKTNRASRFFGRALAEVDQMLKMVKLDYDDLMDRRARALNILVQKEKGGFKEHLVYRVRDDLVDRGYYMFPLEMLYMFRAVCVERINAHRAACGAAPSKKMPELSAEDFLAWRANPRCAVARSNFAKTTSDFLPTI